MRQYSQKCTLSFGMGYAINLLCLSYAEIILVSGRIRKDEKVAEELWRSG